MKKNTVTVKQAIRKGKLDLIFFPILIIFGTPVIGVFLILFYELPPWVTLVFFVLGFFLGSLYWSYNVVKWKIWAYDNVRNVHELKHKAIQYNLIHTDNSWLNKTEIMNNHQREKLQQLEKKFLVEDVYEDDPSVPSEIKVSYSKWEALINFVVFGFLVLFGFIVINTESAFFGWGTIIIGTYYLFKNIRKLFRRTPLFTIGNKGITTSEFGSITWELIPYCYVEVRGIGKGAEKYFVFFAKGKGSHEVLLDETNISIEKLEEYIKIYKVRNGRNHSYK